jgi:hypothetical protein
LILETPVKNDTRRWVIPFVSAKQRAFGHANPEKFGGEEGLKEWESSTPSKLPKYKHGKTTSPDVKKKFTYAKKS